MVENVPAFQISRPPSQSHLRPKHLNQTERYQIYALIKVEQNLKTIAQMLCQHKSTVGRKVIHTVVPSGVSAPNIGILGAQTFCPNEDGGHWYSTRCH
uniref:helix-turn-helix domain-containing protein n=1 Tax=Orrella sp. TaxID=1921583 RepID=UPI004047D3F4